MLSTGYDFFLRMALESVMFSRCWSRKKAVVMRTLHQVTRLAALSGMEGFAYQDEMDLIQGFSRGVVFHGLTDGSSCGDAAMS